MKILVIDRDELSARLLGNRLVPMGHQVTHAFLKDDGVTGMAGDYDVVIIDPSPQTNPRQLLFSIKRSIRFYPYILLLSETIPESEALGLGFNGFLAKPLDPEQVDRKIANAAAFLQIVRHLRDDSEDFPSAGGVIAKSAINQLFLSCIDRADRYGEKTYALFIGLKNYKQLFNLTGEYEAQMAGAKMAQHIVRLRRASDIIGQISTNEYALLLLRPVDAREPVEAAGRFAESLGKCQDIMAKPNMDVEISVSLVEVPSGEKLVEHMVHLRS